MFAALLFAAASTIAAQPVITSITPNSAPAGGGAEITITGSGFQMCPVCSPPTPPEVVFADRMPSPSVTIVNANTLRVAVPAYLPGTYDVTVSQHNGNVTKQNAFTFTGPVEEGFDRVLIPLLTEPVNGAFGSRFITELRLANSSNTRPTYFFGLLPVCRVAACIFVDPLREPYALEPGGVATTPESFDHRGMPGQYLFIPKSQPRVEMNLRVYDQSRSAFNFGTEIPLVYDREFTTEPIKLLGVPIDPRFRTTLRIYATGPTSVLVSYDGGEHVIQLEAGETELHPAYAQFSGIRGPSGIVDVTVEPQEILPPFPGIELPRVWAFISVTNNETQLITTITPQR